MRFAFFDKPKGWKKVLFWGVVCCLFLFVVSVAIVLFNTDKIKQTFIREINKHLLTEVSVKEIDVGILSSFPLVSVSFSDIVMPDAYPDSTLCCDTLAVLQQVKLKFNLIDILKGRYNVTKVEVLHGKIKLKVLSSGEINYHFWKSDTTSMSSDFAFSIKDFRLKDIDLEYVNEISKLLIGANLSDARASGDFSSQKQNIVLSSQLQLRRFAFDKVQTTSDIPIKLKVVAANDFAQKTASIKESKILVGKMEFGLDGRLNYEEDLFVDCDISGRQIKLSEALSLVKKEGKELFSDYKTSGDLAFSAKIKGKLAKDAAPSINATFSLSNASARDKKKDINITNVKINGSYTNGERCNSVSSKLDITAFEATFSQGFVKGKFSLADFNKIDVDASLQAEVNLSQIKDLLKLDSTEVLQGVAKIDLNLQRKNSKLKMNGKGELRDLALQDKRLKNHALAQTNCDLTFDNSTIKISKAKGLLNNKAFALCGTYNLEGRVQADLQLRQYKFDGMTLDNIDAKINYNKGVIDCKKVSFNIFEGSVSSNDCKILFQDSCTIVKADAVLKDINLQKAFAQTKNLNQTLLTDKNIEGKLSAKAKAGLYFDKDFNLVLERSTLDIDYTLSKGRLKNVKMLEKLSYFVDEQALKNVKFETISSSVQIKDGVIAINPIKVFSNAVNFDLVGRHCLDGKIDYNVAVKLSEFASKRKKAAMQKQQQQFGTFESGADNRITLFVKIGGTIDKPTFSYDIKGNMQRAKEQIKQDKQSILQSIDKDFDLKLEQNRQDKQQWKRQQEGEYIIEWEQEGEKKPENKEKQFEDSEFSVEWE